jgi:hypothetical protein
MVVILVILSYIVVGVINGCVGRKILNNKFYYGSDNHGFVWGFWLGGLGLIVCACKPVDLSYYEPLVNAIQNESKP